MYTPLVTTIVMRQNGSTRKIEVVLTIAVVCSPTSIRDAHL